MVGVAKGVGPRRLQSRTSTVWDNGHGAAAQRSPVLYLFNGCAMRAHGSPRHTPLERAKALAHALDDVAWCGARRKRALLHISGLPRPWGRQPERLKAVDGVSVALVNDLCFFHDGGVVGVSGSGLAVKGGRSAGSLFCTNEAMSWHFPCRLGAVGCDEVNLSKF